MNTVTDEVIAEHIEQIGWLNAAKFLLDRHREAHGRERPMVLVTSDHDETDDQWEAVVVTPSAKQSGYWQISYFGAHGFTGDSQCPSTLIALRRAMSDGFVAINPDLLKRVSQTPAFLAGQMSRSSERTHSDPNPVRRQDKRRVLVL